MRRVTDRTAQFLAYLEAHDVGAQPVIFICHSLGGLLAKQALRHAFDREGPKLKNLLEQTRGIVFLGTRVPRIPRR